MKLSDLLHQRRALLRQAHLANLAYAYQRLGEFTARIARANLTGEAYLQPPDPESRCFEGTLTALQGNQSVIEEHFTEEDITELSELLAFAADEEPADLTFRLEELAGHFLPALRRELEQAGVTLGPGVRQFDEPSHREKS